MLAVDHRGQAGVGQARDRDPAVGGEVAQRLAHLGGPGGAVEADHVDRHGVEGGQGGADLGARQHAAGQLDGHLDLEGDLAAERGHGPPGPVDGRLGLQQVEDGLDDEEVDPALEQARSPAPRRRRGARRRGSGRGWGTWCPGPCCRPPSGAVRRPRTRRPAAGPAGPPARLSSRARSARPYSARTTEEAPKVSVSITSTPTSRKERCSRSTASGSRHTRSSLQPSSSGPPKSSGPRSGAGGWCRWRRRR